MFHLNELEIIYILGTLGFRSTTLTAAHVLWALGKHQNTTTVIVNDDDMRLFSFVGKDMAKARCSSTFQRYIKHNAYPYVQDGAKAITYDLTPLIQAIISEASKWTPEKPKIVVVEDYQTKEVIGFMN